MTEQEQKNEMQDWSDELVQACAEFVKFKDDLDAANKVSYVHSPLIRKLRWFCGFYEPNTKNNYREPSAVMPSNFAENALPLLCTLSKHNGEYYKCLINPQLVVSGTYKSYNRDITGGYTDTNAEDVMNWSDKYVAGNTHQVIAYLKIIPFPRCALPVYKALGVDEAKPRWDIRSLLKLRKTRLRTVGFQMSS